jgi:hypothetical protein
MDYLNNVTCGCTLVTHGASQRHRKSRASQSCAQFAAAIRSPAGCGRQDGSRLRCLPPSSIPIPSTSGPIETGCCCHRGQDCLHGKAFRRIGRTATFIRQPTRRLAQRRCDSRTGGVSSTEKEAWVNGQQVVTAFNWNIGLIVCYRQNWNKFMRCWCQTSDGRFKQLRRN